MWYQTKKKVTKKKYVFKYLQYLKKHVVQNFNNISSNNFTNHDELISMFNGLLKAISKQLSRIQLQI